MRPLSLLVTGLNGVVGWNIFLEAKRQSCSVSGTYRKPHNFFLRENAFRVDLDDSCEVERFVRHLAPQYVIHTRAICDLDVCEENPAMAWAINVEATRILLRACRLLRDFRRFVYLSTDHVFSGDRGGYCETDKPMPRHVYGRTKREAECLVLESGLPCQIIRPGLVIGPSVQGNKGPRDFLFSRIRASKPTHLFTDEWRSPVTAEELSRRVLDLMRYGESGIFHVAGPDVYNRYDLACKLAKEHGLPTHQLFPRLRREDKWAAIRPENLTLQTNRLN